MTVLNVFITGASSGIGEALTRAYAQRGALLGLVARRRERLENLIAVTGATGRAYALDVRDRGALLDAARLHLRDYGCPDIVIANAGVSAGTITESIEDLQIFARIVETNLIALVATFQPFIEAMRARGNGTLVVMASVAGMRGLPGGSAYSASKAAAISYAESLRVELRDSGIRVVTIAPGYIDTPMTRGNPYRMPFLMKPDKFARRALNAIERGDAFRVIPWQMGIVAWLLKRLPRPIYDRVFARAPRKPRIVAMPMNESTLHIEEETSSPHTFTPDMFVEPHERDESNESSRNGSAKGFGSRVQERGRTRITTWQERASWPKDPKQ